MVSQVIKLTGSSNHNICSVADVKDPKPWCYTVDPNKRWEHCSPLCSAKPPPVTTQRPQPTQLDFDDVVGTRFRDVPEQVPQFDPRSKYDRNGNCIRNCNSRVFSVGLSQCGENSIDTISWTTITIQCKASKVLIQNLIDP